MKAVSIDGRIIGHGRTFVIAELSANHLFDRERTLRLVEAIASTGADALKIQTLTVDSMTIDSGRPEFIVQHECPWKGKRLYDLYQETPLPYEWHEEIFRRCRELGLVCFSTPYDLSSLEFLKTFSPPAFKISSFEAVDVPLIRAVAGLGKPVIISTGIADLAEIELAVNTCRAEGNNDVVLLKCISAYPAPPNEMNLATIPDMRKRFDVEVGLSDHSLGSTIPLGAVALGASVLEKHVTLKRADGGPDCSFSMEVEEFASMVSQIRQLEEALGKVDYTVSASSLKGKHAFGRSLFAVDNIDEGELFTVSNVRSIRPGCGLPPMFMEAILGRSANCFIERGTPLAWQLIR
jgi:pseudaminic acid synthase